MASSVMIDTHEHPHPGNRALFALPVEIGLPILSGARAIILKGV